MVVIPGGVSMGGNPPLKPAGGQVPVIRPPRLPWLPSRRPVAGALVQRLRPRLRDWPL